MKEVSRLFLQSGESYKICNVGSKEFYVKNPSLQDIINLETIDVGEYFKYVFLLVSTSKDIADILLVESDIWYEDITDEYMFFLQKTLSVSGSTVAVKETIKKDINTFEVCNNYIAINKDYRDALNFFLGTTGEYVYYSSESDMYLLNVERDTQSDSEVFFCNENSFKFNKHNYNIICQYLKKINWINADYDFLKGGTKYAKKYILKNDYKKRKKNEGKEPRVDLSSIVSSLIAYGQDYNNIKKYSIYLIYETYYRFNKINEWNNTMQALYSGCIDTKKHPIDYEKINWANIIK